jgi:anthranilate phosphoribosyltransferase
VERMTVTPESFGFVPQSGDGILGGDAARNRVIAESVLEGERGAPRDIVLINSALAIVAAGNTQDLREAAAIAAESIDSGAAKSKLDRLSSITCA